MGLRVERLYPLVLGLVAAAAYLIFYRHHVLPNSLANLFAASISIASIAVGFFVTAKTAVVQLEPTRPLITKLRQADRYDGFLKYMSTAIYASFALALLSAFGLVDDFVHLDWRARTTFAVWIFSAVFAGLAYFRVVRVLNVILDSPPGNE